MDFLDSVYDNNNNNNNNTNNTNNIMSLINLLNINNTSEEYETCMICKEDINCMEKCKLPECQHEFHVNCIISWFRNGDSRCPYCGNKGLNNCNEVTNKGYSGFYGRFVNLQKFNDIKSFVYAKKNANNPTVAKTMKKFEKLKETQDKLKLLNDEFSEFKKKIKTENGNYKEIRSKISNYRSKRYTLKRSINDQQLLIVETSHIIPLIIPMPVLM